MLGRKQRHAVVVPLLFLVRADAANSDEGGGGGRGQFQWARQPSRQTSSTATNGRPSFLRRATVGRQCQHGCSRQITLVATVSSSSSSWTFRPWGTGGLGLHQGRYQGRLHSDQQTIRCGSFDRKPVGGRWSSCARCGTRGGGATSTSGTGGSKRDGHGGSRWRMNGGCTFQSPICIHADTIVSQKPSRREKR